MRTFVLLPLFAQLNDVVPLDGKWTDYVGNNPITDLGEDPIEWWEPWEDSRHYEFGVDEYDVDTGETQYLRDDLLGTAVARTDVPTSGYAQTIERKIYTAFGELIYYGGSAIDGCPMSAHDRYGYAGQWGYEEHDISSNGQISSSAFGDGIADNWILASPIDGFPFMHTGARYYDPATGRFLQRDPIGLAGGSNVYAYVVSSPVASVDPSGLAIAGPDGEVQIGGRTPPRDKSEPVTPPKPKPKPNPGTKPKPKTPPTKPAPTNPVVPFTGAPPAPVRPVTPARIPEPLGTLHRCESTVVLSTVGMVGAACGDILMTVSCMPLYVDNLRWFECTRTVGEAIADEWRY